MSQSLIIVESPTKVKTIKKYLGPDFDVKATSGHIKDLPKSSIGIDIDNNFEPTYTVIPSKKKNISELKKAARNADTIYLAPDPDREGEAIAWHVAQEIDTSTKEVYRILFNDLTKPTVFASLKNPGTLDTNKYDAQQTRRMLDRLVGYQISPILWDKVKRGLSAGRVQSVAVRIICDREKEIQAFASEEFWTITALLDGKNPPPFEARLIKIEGKKAKISNGEESETICEELKKSDFIVSSVTKKETKGQSPPPFTTSKLQQEASRKLRFSAKKTMSLAQKLYEGIDIGSEGSVGLITYMRTDSVRIADEALNDSRAFIARTYGDTYLPNSPRRFKSSKSAQDAHEAIRPASLSHPPGDIKQYLGRDEFRLYQLIWNRFIASQMKPALFDRTTIDITAGSYVFRAAGSIMKFPGYTIVYSESRDNDAPVAAADENLGVTLPDCSEGETVRLSSLTPQQNFTQPPPRFSEASLVKELEEKGIGRPSTYASILSTIQDRKYVSLNEGRFHPTELGVVVNDLLVENFPNILDIQFTASMEENLDRIEEGTLSRRDALRSFYEPFQSELDHAKTNMRNVKREETPTDITCDKCGNIMVIKWGKNGKFLACSNYPECKNTMNFVLTAGGKIEKSEPESTDVVCEKCGRPMVIKEGRYGRFLGCSGYPDCRHTQPLTMGVRCPEEGCDGFLAEKRTRKGKTFYGCTNYPKCKYAIWNRPINEPCPLCGFPFLVEKDLRSKGAVKACPNKDCNYSEAL